jgi:hypothetical protein
MLLLVLLLAGSGCGVDVGSSSKSDSDNTNNNINTNINQDSDSSLITCRELSLSDGPEGFTYKPVSESDGLPVILFPVQFSQEFTAVRFTLKIGGFEEAALSGFTNGNRQTWRLSLPAENYTGGFVIFTQNSECSYELDPLVRQD